MQQTQAFVSTRGAAWLEQKHPLGANMLINSDIPKKSTQTVNTSWSYLPDQVLQHHMLFPPECSSLRGKLAPWPDTSRMVARCVFTCHCRCWVVHSAEREWIPHRRRSQLWKVCPSTAESFAVLQPCWTLVRLMPLIMQPHQNHINRH